ncbi:MAG: biotin synthase BioB [Planctomycetota bacterium]|nr:MAG: biotin synthase BioB [Planctomycetota bacterium]
MPATQTSPDARLADLSRLGCAGQPVGPDDARWILTEEAVPLLPLAHAAGLVRRRFFGDRVQVHMLHNVQCGACPEDCGYCGQARTSDAPIAAHKLKGRDEILAEAKRAKDAGAFRYCMVLSGRGPDDADVDFMAGCIREVKARFGLETCLSAGLMDEAKARRLKDAGLDRLNHNLNTSKARYPDICSTHTYGDRVETLRAARSAGLAVCSGLIVGMGESADDIIEVGRHLRALGAESIPVNFLVPIPGNAITRPVSCGAPLTPAFCLRVLCAMRLLNPSAEIRMAAGREIHLRSLQPVALEPANSLFIDGYLLTRGSPAFETLRMIRDAGFTVALPAGGATDELRALLDALDAPGPEIGVIKDEHVSPRKLARLSVSAEPAGHDP